jgi:hypothetical protein
LISQKSMRGDTGIGTQITVEESTGLAKAFESFESPVRERHLVRDQ